MTRSPIARENRRVIHSIRKPALPALFLCAVACLPVWSQSKDDLRAHSAGGEKLSRSSLLLTRHEGESITTIARNTHLRRGPGRDCSHLVHTIYQRAGFSYPYADSSDLYRGTNSFVRVKHSQPGDLIVWRGHVGIVVNPAHHTFFSALSHGPGTARYDALYWKRRGPAKFYRYVKAEQSATALPPE